MAWRPGVNSIPSLRPPIPSTCGLTPLQSILSTSQVKPQGISTRVSTQLSFEWWNWKDPNIINCKVLINKRRHSDHCCLLNELSLPDGELDIREELQRYINKRLEEPGLPASSKIIVPLDKERSVLMGLDLHYTFAPFLTLNCSNDFVDEERMK